jgi:hypothetical protein
MAWSKVTWYSLGFNVADKQGYFYYGLEGDASAHQVFVTAPELTALAEMFRDAAGVTYNSDGHYFATQRRDLPVDSPGGDDPIPEDPSDPKPPKKPKKTD